MILNEGSIRNKLQTKLNPIKILKFPTLIISTSWSDRQILKPDSESMRKNFSEMTLSCPTSFHYPFICEPDYSAEKFFRCTLAFIWSTPTTKCELLKKVCYNRMQTTSFTISSLHRSNIFLKGKYFRWSMAYEEFNLSV